MAEPIVEQERWAIHVDGIAVPDFNSEDEAKKEIGRRPELQSKGAVAIRLYGNPSKVKSNVT